MAASRQDQRHEALGERGRMHPRVFQLLVGTNRALVAAGLIALVPIGLFLGGLLYPEDVVQAFAEREPVRGLHEALVISTVTGATLVLTLSQIVLSEEFGPVGEQRDRTRAAMDFRRKVEDVIPGGVSPPTPSNILRVLAEGILERTASLEESVEAMSEPQAVEDIEDYAEGLRQDTRILRAQLAGSRFGTFETVAAALNYDLSAILHETRELKSSGRTPLTTEVDRALADLLEVLELFGTARSHIKGLYFQYELVDLSRWILLASFPAIIVAVVSVLFFDPTAFASAWLALLVASLTVAVALSPFAILLAYIARILTVTRKTLSRGPFIVPG